MYQLKLEEVGQVETQMINTVDIPRSVFLELVDKTLEASGLDTGEAKEVRALAETVERFYVAGWIHSVRGCGCLVGEYIIAKSDLSREEIAKKLRMGGGAYITQFVPPSSPLWRFGCEIDRAIVNHLGKVGVLNLRGAVDRRAYARVDSVGIIDG